MEGFLIRRRSSRRFFDIWWLLECNHDHPCIISVRKLISIPPRNVFFESWGKTVVINDINYFLITDSTFPAVEQES